MNSLIDLLRFELDEKNLPIRAEQVRARIDSYPLMLVAELVLAPMLVMLMWNKIPHAALQTWLVAVYCVHAIEYLFLASSSLADEDRFAKSRLGPHVQTFDRAGRDHMGQCRRADVRSRRSGLSGPADLRGDGHVGGSGDQQPVPSPLDVHLSDRS